MLQVYQNFWGLKKGFGVNCHGFVKPQAGNVNKMSHPLARPNPP